MGGVIEAYIYIYIYIYIYTHIYMNVFGVSRSGRISSASRESEPYGFEPWPSQINDFSIDTCRFLVWCLALLGYGEDWLDQCQDNMTEWCVGAG